MFIMPHKPASYANLPWVNLYPQIADAAFERGLDTGEVGEGYLRSDQKRKLDRYAARVLLAVTYPAVLGARSAVRLNDGKPAIINLPRIGQDYRLFDQMKIRSMVYDADQYEHRIGEKSGNDPRITPPGRIIRGFSIDELPQFYNILRGEMSLVGPRPRTVQRFYELANRHDNYAESYTAAKPGLTGPEQIYARADATESQIVELTRDYARNASLAADLEILRKTPLVVVRRNGAY